jgi:hypothetical protein
MSCADYNIAEDERIVAMRLVEKYTAESKLPGKISTNCSLGEKSKLLEERSKRDNCGSGAAHLPIRL